MIHKFIFLILFFINLNILFSGTSTQGEAYESFLNGEYEILRNNFMKAEKYFTKALSLSPDSPTILQSLVDLKSYQGEYADVIQYLEQIMAIEPDNKNSGLTLYKFLIQERDSIKAEKVLDSLLFHYPGDHDILFSRANTQFSNQDWPNLLKTYYDIYISDPDQDDLLNKIYEIGIATGNIKVVHEILWELKPGSDNSIIVELLIQIAHNMGEYHEAINLMEELIEINENSDELKINLSALFIKVEHFEKVIEILQPIYEAGNYSLNILRMLLISTSMLGQIEEEIDISKTLLNEYPDLSVGYEALSFAYLQSGSNQKAMEVLQQALSKFPNEITFPYSLATILSSSGDYNKAKNYFHHVLTMQPDFVSAQYGLAMMYEEMDDIQHSDSLFLHMIYQDNNDAVSHNDYAYILSVREETSIEELNYALKLVEKAIAVDPDNAAFLDTIGWIYYKLGAYEKAKEYLEKSLNINNNNPVILEHLGDIYVKLDKSLEAVNIYEQVLSIDANNQLIKDKINKIYE